VQHNTHLTINVAGDLTEETSQRLMQDVYTAIDQKTPGIVNQSAANVQRRRKADGNFLQR